MEPGRHTSSSDQAAVEGLTVACAAIVFLANLLNYVDRQLVSALEQPLRGALGLTGAEFGLLWTLFTIGYMVSGLPIGLLARRLGRPRLLAVCILVWSGACFTSGMAHSKGMLYISRFVTGIGEAGCLVIGPSLITDLFPAKLRGRALSAFYLAMPLGGAVAFLLAGAVFDIGWRNTLYLAGAPGVLVALMTWLMPDPQRADDDSGPRWGRHGGIGPYVELLKNRTLMFIILAHAFAVVIFTPLIHFGVEFLVDTRGMGRKEARLGLGLAGLFAGTLGIALSGFLADKLSKARPGAAAFLAGTSALAAWPCVVVGVFATNRWVFLPAITLGCFFYFLFMPAVNTHIANATTPSQRPAAWALALLLLHLLGDMLAPPLYGIVSDAIPRDWAFSMFSVGLVLSAACSFAAYRTASSPPAREEPVSIVGDSQARTPP